MNKKNVEKGHYFLSEKTMSSYFKSWLNGGNVNWDIFILINRKGYWDYKIFFPKGYKKSENQIIISDRYLDKCPKKELVKLLSGKAVIVYDDSLTNGGNLFSYYLLCKRAGAKKVVPVVYALSVDFPTAKSYSLMRQEIEEAKKDLRFDFYFDESEIEVFINEMKCKILLAWRDIDRMSIKQTQIFQKYESPLVMDLPIINHVKGDKTERITLSIEQFEKLRDNKDDYWEFVDNKMNGWGKTVVASYFQYKDDNLGRSLGSLFHDFVVKCKYNYVEDKVQVVFTPFAIVKSSSLKNVFQNFRLFYENTLYGEKLLGEFPGSIYNANIMKKDPNLCKALYRAVIFRLSDYIGRQFMDYMKEVLGMDLEYDWEIMKDNFDADFIETQRIFYDSFNGIEFEKMIFNCHNDERIFLINKSAHGNSLKVKATQERIENYTSDEICKIKQSSTQRNQLGKVYIFEALEREIKEKYYFSDEEEEKRMLTKVILCFLETNRFSNCLYVDKAQEVIYRGFRYGENSDIFLHENFWFFYAYLFPYYTEYASGNIQKSYAEFMEWLEQYFEQEKVFDCWISRDGFHYLKNYFSRVNNLGEEVIRRVYMLNCSEFGKEAANRAEVIQKAAEIVKQLGRA